MDQEKQRQEVSLIGRILSMEALLLLMGIVSLFYGVTQGATMSIFWGVLIILGVVVLTQVRKKDWTKHWADMEAEHKAAQTRHKPVPPADTPPEA